MLLILLLSLLQVSNASKYVPLFLLDYDHAVTNYNVHFNPFSKISPSYFADIVQDARKHSACIILFIEDKLSTEDISSKDIKGSPYRYLHEDHIENKVHYMPSVAEPFKLLSAMLQPTQFNVFEVSLGTRISLQDSHKHIYVHFRDSSNLTRVEALRNHDFIMHEVYSSLRRLRNGAVVAFYTGKSNPVDLGSREMNPQPLAMPKDSTVYIMTGSALFKFSGVFTASSARRSTFDRMPVVGEEMWSHMQLSTTMQYEEFELHFNFMFEKSSWRLDNVALFEAGEEVGRTIMGVSAPLRMSYVCASPLTILNTRDDSSVTISRYQIQPFNAHRSRRQGEGADDGKALDPTGNGNANDEPSEPTDSDESTEPTESDDKDYNATESNGTESNGTESGCKFGPSVSCDPYFNVEILSGLFVAFILLLILFYGIMIMYDCGGNNKFDDPDGKELIVASD